MRLSQGVEWAVHACTLLAALADDRFLSLAALAEFHGVPAPYMAKQMQSLSRADIVRTKKGAAGGYALAKPANAISLYDIVRAIEGPEPTFRCTEIRQRGPCAKRPGDCRKACGVAAAFAGAEAAWRAHLKDIKIAHMVTEAAGASTPPEIAKVMQWMEGNAVN